MTLGGYNDNEEEEEEEEEDEDRIEGDEEALTLLIFLVLSLARTISGVSLTDDIRPFITLESQV